MQPFLSRPSSRKTFCTVQCTNFASFGYLQVSRRESSRNHYSAHQSKRTTTTGDFWAPIIGNSPRALLQSDARQPSISCSFLYALTLPGWYCLVDCAVTLTETPKEHKSSALKGGIAMSRNFYLRTRVKFTCVNRLVAMYERPRVKVKGSRATLHTLPPFYLSAEMLRACRHN